MTYAGIGSRRTPDDVLEQMTQLAQELGKLGWTLRSGGADGADRAFQDGAEAVGGRREIFLPWAGYNGLDDDSTVVLSGVVERDAMDVARRHHPAWGRCRQGARKLHARNTAIIHGRDLCQPVDAVVCWTPNAVAVGGTATGIRVAEALEIPVFNLARFQSGEVLDRLTRRS